MDKASSTPETSTKQESLKSLTPTPGSSSSSSSSSSSPIQSLPQKTFAERIIKNTSKNSNWNQALNLKQTVNQTSSIVHTNKSQKRFIEIKKRNQTNSVIASSTQ